MIAYYGFATPNSWKVSILLEELGLPYEVHSIDIMKGEQYAPAFAAISPHNKVPIIVDPEGPDGEPITIAESTAIVLYLAAKAGSPLLPTEPRAYFKVMQWLSLQTSTLAAMFAQLSFFERFAAERVPLALDYYGAQTRRVLVVLERQLSANRYLAGDDYSVADTSTYGWILAISRVVDLAEWPSISRWCAELGARPAVQRGVSIPEGAHHA